MRISGATTYAASIDASLAVFATQHPDEFTVQCEYREMFAGPLARHVKYGGSGSPMPLIVDPTCVAAAAVPACAACDAGTTSVQEKGKKPADAEVEKPKTDEVDKDDEKPEKKNAKKKARDAAPAVDDAMVAAMKRATDSTNPRNYYADAFATDTSALTVTTTPHPAGVSGPISGVIVMCADIFKTFELAPIARAKTGTRCFVDRATFDARLRENLVIRYSDGRIEPDKALLDVFDGAGKENYCVAGGFIAKLLDPSAGRVEFSRSDIDIFVYGADQVALIDKLIAKVTATGTNLLTIRGGVVNIYRAGAMKVQVVSSAFDTPLEIVSNFDLSHVMAYWTRGTVHVTAPCLKAFATRETTIGSSVRVFSPFRIIKSILAGFYPTSDSRGNMPLIKLDSILKDPSHIIGQTSAYIALIERVAADCDPTEFFARISLANHGSINIMRIINRHDSGKAQSITGEHECESECDVLTFASAHPDAVTTSASAKSSIARRMAMRTVINDYRTFEVRDADWATTLDVGDNVLPMVVESFPMPLIAAGMKAKFDVHGSMRSSGGNTAIITITDEADTARIAMIVGAIRAAFVARGFTLDSANQSASIIAVDIIPSRAHPPSTRVNPPIKVFPRISKLGDKSYKLVFASFAQ
jgi:hypothetical protein